jgi:hypothetical protein
VSKTSPQLATLLARQRSYTRSAETISVSMDALSRQLATLLARQRSYTCSAGTISVSTDALSPQLATLLARQCIYTCSAEIISVPPNASSPQLTTLLAQQRSYTRSAEIISVPTDASSILTDASGTKPSPNTLRGLVSSTHTFARRWQHARGLRLAVVFICPALSTRSGAAPRSGVHSSSVGNMLGGCASQWCSFARRWQHAWGLRLALVFIRPGVGNTLGGCTSHWCSIAQR